MPIYEYRCENCGKVAEVLQKSFAQKEPSVCTNCGSTEMKKMISPPGFIAVGGSTPKGTTCCGREERCSTPPCSDDGVCGRDR
jgi:putative FmdB family regulatory protein